jgi:hypothetical protein
VLLLCGCLKRVLLPLRVSFTPRLAQLFNFLVGPGQFLITLVPAPPKAPAIEINIPVVTPDTPIRQVAPPATPSSAARSVNRFDRVRIMLGLDPRSAAAAYTELVDKRWT